MEKPQKPSPIWDSEKKRPSKLIFSLMIIIAASFFFWGIIGIFNEVHVIRVVIEYDGPFKGEIRIDETLHAINGESNEYTYSAREGTNILVQIDKMGTRTDPITISIYDNNKLVADRTSTERLNPTSLSYTVGE